MFSVLVKPSVPRSLTQIIILKYGIFIFVRLTRVIRAPSGLPISSKYFGKAGSLLHLMFELVLQVVFEESSVPVYALLIHTEYVLLYLGLLRDLRGVLDLRDHSLLDLHLQLTILLPRIIIVV